MKILHVYKDFSPVVGGIENHIGDLAREQASLGHAVSVLVTAPVKRRTETIEDGVRVVRVPRLGVVASTPLSPWLFLALAGESPDVTHLHFPYPPGEVAQLLLRRGTATVLTYHSDIVRQRGLLTLYHPLLLALLARVDLVLATSEPYVRSSPYLRRVVHKTVVAPLGIAHQRFDPPPPGAITAMRARMGAGAADPRPVILSVGRLRYYKGLDVAIRAMRDVDARLVLAGTGPMEATWRELARSVGVEERVRFLGEIDDADLPACYHAADIYVSSATQRSEAFGISILEAMACGKPIVSTELGTGTSFVNLDQQTGLVVPPGDPAELAAALRQLLGSPETAARFGRAARARVEAEFTLPVMTRRVLAAYARALGTG